MTMRLAYVALALNAPQRTERLFGEDLRLPRGEAVLEGERLPAFRAGAVALVLFPSGHPFLSGRVEAGLDHLGLSGVDPESADLQGAPGSGIGGTTQSRVAPEEAAGACLRLSPALDLGVPATASPHVERIDHIGIASVDNRAAEQVFVGRLGPV